jgi:hypothetical protein
MKKADHMMCLLNRQFLFFFAATFFLANPGRAGDADHQQNYLNGGYYLLHKLGSDEDQVPLLMDLKHAPKEIAVYADRMSQTGKETMAQIERIQQKHPATAFDKNPLPAIEQDTRDSIKADKQHQLLFGTKDTEFVRAFLISQIEASTYGMSLAKVLAAGEQNPATVHALQHLAAQWLQRRDEAFQILRNY